MKYKIQYIIENFIIKIRMFISNRSQIPLHMTLYFHIPIFKLSMEKDYNIIKEMVETTFFQFSPKLYK